MIKLNPFNESILNNPLYQLDARRLKRGATPESLMVWSRTVIIRVFLIFGILIVIFAGIQRHSEYQRQVFYQQNYNSPYYIQETFPFIVSVLALAAGVIFLISIASNFFLDLAAINASLGVINQDVGNGRWDLVRITALEGEQIVNAKHTLTRLRCWRMMITIFAMRVLVLVLLVLTTLVNIFAHRNGFWAGLSDYISGFFRQPIENILLLLLMIGWAAIYLGEVFYRHRTLTAVMLGLSTGRNTTNAILTGLAGVMAIWIAQGFMLFFIFWMISVINWLLSPTVWRIAILAFFAILSVSALIIALFFHYYRFLYQWGVRMITRRALVE
jgi:hypothetical protein